MDQLTQLLLWLPANYEWTAGQNQQIIQLADSVLELGPYSVIDKKQLPPSGDRHDYMSWGIYWWPNPDTENGLPYIRKDGRVNPEVREISDHRNLEKTISQALVLGMAYQLTEEQSYSAQGAKLLRTWFLADRTRMNPHLAFGQGVPGRSTGRCYGIIETRYISQALDAGRLIMDSPDWSEEDQEQLQSWLLAFRDWLLESELGQEEQATLNNHGTWYDVQVASISLRVGDTLTTRRTLERSALRAHNHIDSLGRQPEELARTRSFDYSRMNLLAFYILATLGDKVGVNLWSIPSAESSALVRALQYLVPYAEGRADWPYEQIRPIRASSLLPHIELLILKYPAMESRYASYLKAARQNIDLLPIGAYNLP